VCGVCVCVCVSASSFISISSSLSCLFANFVVEEREVSTSSERSHHCTLLCSCWVG